MKYFLLLLLFYSFNARSSHVVGGEIYYECLGDNNYEVTLELFFDCLNSTIDFDPSVEIEVYRDNFAGFYSIELFLTEKSRIGTGLDDKCLVKELNTNLCLRRAEYKAVINFPANESGYYLTYYSCCRNASIVNLNIPSEQGAAYTSRIPNPEGPYGCNNSPQFVNRPKAVICGTRAIAFDHSATDSDGDSLYYYFCAGKTREKNSSELIDIDYAGNYSFLEPMDANPKLQIDPNTGLLTGLPTITNGQYIVTICVDEIRNGVVLNTLSRDFQFNVGDCTAINEAEMTVNGIQFFGIDGTYSSCESLTIDFENLWPDNPSQNYFWDFGVLDRDNDTSRAVVPPAYTYPDTGQYKVVLIAKGTADCSDTHRVDLKLYPTLEAKFDYIPTCNYDSAVLTDISESTYGTITDRNWSVLGMEFNSSDSSISFPFEHEFDHFINLVVTNTFGCVDEFRQSIRSIPTPDATFRYTTLCAGAPISFIPTEINNTHSYEWILGDTIVIREQQPFVEIDSSQDIIMLLTVTNAEGCKANYFEILPISTGPLVRLDSSVLICPDEPFFTNTFGQNIDSFFWKPSIGMLKPNEINPVISIENNTTYSLVYNNECLTDTATIVVNVYPIPKNTIDDYYKINHGDSVFFQVAEPAVSLECLTEESVNYQSALSLYITPPRDNLYQFLVIDANGCNSTISSFIEVEPYCEQTKTPSAFTPNNDGIDDHFSVIDFGGNDITNVKIWNRWGEVVYFNGENDIGWDGLINGNPAPIGVYTYEAFVNCESSKTNRLTGHVTLLR